MGCKAAWCNKNPIRSWEVATHTAIHSLHHKCLTENIPRFSGLDIRWIVFKLFTTFVAILAWQQILGVGSVIIQYISEMLKNLAKICIWGLLELSFVESSIPTI